MATIKYMFFCALLAVSMTCRAEVSVVRLDASEPDETGAVTISWVMTGWQEPYSVYPIGRYNVFLVRMDTSNLENISFLPGAYIDQSGVHGSYVDTLPANGETYYYWLCYAPYNQQNYTYNFAYRFLNGDYNGILNSTYGPVSVYMPVGFVVSFNANGGSGDMNDQIFLTGVTQALSENQFVRDGYDFCGWANSSEMAATGGVEYVNGAMISVESDIELYAVWKETDFEYDLKATTNLTESIDLTWNARVGHVGEKYIIYRSLDLLTGYKEVARDVLTSYTDSSCLPGVNYYYYVRATEGPNSKVVLGRMAVKEFEPKFDVVLIGDDVPQDKGATGSAGEKDVLVAGHRFTCEVSLENSLPEEDHDISIKYVMLVGKPLGGAAKQKAHTIVSACNVSSIDEWLYQRTHKDYVMGEHLTQNGNTFNFTAVLNSGEGYHGRYEWTAFCKYEVDGKLLLTMVKGSDKNVYFAKKGTDNGIPNTEPGHEGEIVPNWYAYWKADGACPGLNDPRVVYAGDVGENGQLLGGAANAYESIEEKRRVYLNSGIVELWRPITVLNQAFMTWDGKRRVYGIYKVEDVVAHEWQHHATMRRYNLQTQVNGEPDSDIKWSYCVTEGGGIAKCKIDAKINTRICDYIVDVDEIGDYFNLKQLFGSSFPGLSPTNTDTYSLWKIKDGTYRAYGDNELVSMVAGRKSMHNANPDRDWSYPGEIAGGIPLVASPYASSSVPAIKALTTKAENPKGRLNNEPIEESSDTNLFITVDSISVHMPMDGAIVTGIVYTIGTTIQGNKHVEFEGHMYDAESNVVAKAFAMVHPDTTVVEFFFDAKDIYANSTDGPFTLGRVLIRFDSDFAKDNIINELYDFAIAPIDVERSKLLCDKGRVVSSAIAEVTTTSVVASASVQINVEGNYRLSAELVTTNGDLVAVASASQYCAAGAKDFNLVFSGDSIYQSGRCGIYAMRNLQLRCAEEFVTAHAGPAELPTIYDFTYFAPQGAHAVVDMSSGSFVEPTATANGMLSALKFAFDVSNSDDATSCYDLTSFLTGTNSGIVAAMTTSVVITNGINRIEITVPASLIADSGIDGPYRFESIELQPRSTNFCGTTYRPTAISGEYVASDFGATAITLGGPSRLGDGSDDGKLTFECPYNALRVGRIIAEVVLVDKNGDFAANVTKVDDVSEIGPRTCTVDMTRDDITGVDAGAPYAVASFSLRPDIPGELPIYADTASLTNIYWPSSDPIPELAEDAAPEEVTSILAGMEDANLAVNLTNVAQYAAYRTWALSLTNDMVSAQSVKDSPRAWLSYALGVNRLIDTVITSNDLRIVSFKVNEYGESGTARPRSFTFEVAIDGVEIGSGSVAEETLKANLKKVLGLEGAATLTPGTFSSDNIEITFEKPVAGRAKFSANPSHDVGNTFFMRVKVKCVQ